MAKVYLTELYNNLKEDGWVENDYDNFKQFFNAPGEQGYKNRKALYDNMKEDGYVDSPTYEDFMAKIEYTVDKPQPEAAAPSTVTEPSVKAPSAKPWQPSLQDRLRASWGIAQSVDSFKQGNKAVRDKEKRQAEMITPEGRNKAKAAKASAKLVGADVETPLFGGGDTGGAATPTTPTQPQPTFTQSPQVAGVKFDENGQPVTEWMLPDGTLTTDRQQVGAAEERARASRLQHEFEGRMRKKGLDPSKPEDVKKQADYETVGQELEEAYREKEELEAALNRRKEELDKEHDNVGLGTRILRGLSEAVISSKDPHAIRDDNEARNYTADKQYNQLTAALRHNRQAINILEDKRRGKMNEFWLNLGKEMVNGYTFDYGKGQLDDSRALNDAADLVDTINEKHRKGETLNEEEQTAELLLTSLARRNDTEGRFGGDYGAWARAGKMASHSIELLPDFAMGGMNMMQSITTKSLAKMGLKEVAKGFGNKVMRATGIGMGALAGGVAMTNTIQAPRLLSETAKNYDGQLYKDADGNFIIDGKEGFMTSFLKAQRQLIADDASEAVGAFLPGAAAVGRFVGKGLEKIGLSKLNAALTSIGNRQWYQSTNSALKQMGFNGTINEGLEEYAGIGYQALMGDRDALGSLTDMNTHVDIWLGTVTMGALLNTPQYIGTAAYGAQYAKAKHGLNRNDKAAATVYGERWEGIKSQIDGMQNENVAGVLTTMLTDGTASTKEERQALLDYASSLQRMRGMNIGQMMGGTAQDADVAQTYSSGYEASTPQEMVDAQNMYEYQRQRLVTELGSIGEENIEKILNEVETDPVGALNKTYDPALRDIVMDYANAKTVRDGMIQRVNDDIDEQIAQSNAMIDGRVNKESGMIVPATMGLDDRQVYVVSGNIVANEDGTIDKDASDESVIVCDALTGKLEFTDPRSLSSLGDAINPEEERASVIEAIRQQSAQAAVDAMNGTLAFNPGDAVLINDGNTAFQATIVGPAMDEKSGMPVEGQVVVQLPDGQQTVFTKEQLQAFADAANLERINAFEQERAAVRAQQQAAEAEAKRPQFALNDEFTILDEYGNPIRGSITGELNEDGKIEVYTEEPVNGNRVNRFTPEELEEIIDTYNNEPLTLAVSEDAESERTEDNSVINGNNSVNLQHGNGPEQNNDTAAGEPGESAVQPVVTDPAGTTSGFGDRSAIRSYEKGLADRHYDSSEYSERDRRDAESQRLVSIAKANGQYFDRERKASLGLKYPKGTGESEVYRDVKSDKVYKVKNPYAKSPMKGNVQPEDAIYEHLVHNKYFPETAYKFEGISDDIGDVRIVLSQNYFDSFGQASKEQIEAALAEKGLLPEGKYTYGNEEISVTDVTGDNALLGNDGKVYFIDPIINFKKPVKDILGEGNAAEAATPNQTEEMQPTALSRIPVDEEGEPLFEQTDPATAWDGMAEYFGDADDAIEFARSKVKTLKNEKDKLAKAVSDIKATGSAKEFKEAKAKARAELAAKQAQLDHWNSVVNAKIAREQAVAEARRQAEEAERIERQRQYEAQMLKQREAEIAAEKARRQDAERKAAIEAEAQAEAERQAQLPENQERERTANSFEEYVGQMRQEIIAAGAGEQRQRLSERIRTAAGAKQYGDIYAALSDDNQASTTSLEEWVTRALSVNKQRVKWTGNGNLRGQMFTAGKKEKVSEVKQLQWMISDRDGIPFWDFVHKMWETLSADDSAGFNREGITDQDMRNMVIEVLRSHPTSRSLFDSAIEMYDTRMASDTMQGELQQMEHDMDDIRDQWYRENLGTTYYEYNARVEAIYSVIRRSELTDEDIDAINSEIADEQQNINDNGNDNEGALRSGAESVQAEQSDGRAGDASPDVERPETAGRGSNNESGSLATEAETREERLSKAAADIIAKAEAEVNTEPTEAQKEAGNYKMGHVKIDGLDISIENPKGSVRRGTDADGKPWETKMNNTYGYIRGTTGVDGDKIDVFLSDNPAEGNVFVVDQYNPDGSFDEHKVMYGFTSTDEAKAAYLANYSADWAKGRKVEVTGVTRDAFRKWLDASTRKTKPFADYTTVKKKASASSHGSVAEYKSVKPINPSGNKLVTDERYAELRERMRKKFGQLNMGVDPEILAIGTEMAVYHIEKGARKFKAYASAMIADIGDAIRPYLKAFYNAVRDMPEVEETGLIADMDSYEEVRKVDIANFDKPGTNAMATAAAVVEEQKIAGAAEEAGRLNGRIDEYTQRLADFLSISEEDITEEAEEAILRERAVLTQEIVDYYLGQGVETEVAEKQAKELLENIQAQTSEAVARKQQIPSAETSDDTNEGKTVNPNGSTSQTVVKNNAVDTKKPNSKKRLSKPKSKSITDGGLFDAVEDNTTTAPSIIIPEPRPKSDLMGNSAIYQAREAQTVELVEEIGGVIESRVKMLELDTESVKPLTMTEVKKMASKYSALEDISDTDLQELVELAMTQLTRAEALSNIDGSAETQRAAFDHIVNLYQIQPCLNARDSERLIKQQYSTPTPFGYVMGQFVRAGGKGVDSMLEPSAGNGALTITVNPSVIHVNDIDEARLANLRKLGYAQVTAQDALLPFTGEKVDVVMTNPPFGKVTEKVYDGVFRISNLESQMAINALEQMKDDGRAAIVIGGNTSYRTNGSMNPKDAAFFGYLYSHYNVADVINISGKALYSRNGTGYDVRMILINGRKTGEFQRVFPPVKTKARAEQITTFDELYKRIQDDIQQIQQVGSQSADAQREPEATSDGTASASIRSGNNRPNTGAGQRPGTTGDVLRSSSRTDSGQPISEHDGSRPAGMDNADSGDAGSSDNVPQPNSQQPRSVGSGSAQNGTGRSRSDGRGATTNRPFSGTERLAVKPDLTAEKVPYPNQSGNGFTLMSVVPAAQAQVLQKSLGEIGDVDQYLVDELGYSSKEELYNYLAAEQIDSVALAIHQMNKGNAFIIGDMTGVGKGRQGAALIRYAVKQGKVPIYFTQKPTLFTDNYRDLADIGSSDLRPFIIASNPKDANIVDADGNIVHKLPSKKEQERVFAYILEHGSLPDEYDYILTTYDQIKNGTADYAQNENGTWNTEARKLPKKSKGYTTADHNGQTRRDALAKLAEGNIAILDESHTVGGDSGCGRYMQMLTSSAGGVTFLSATFAKRADNMPIYAQRTAIAEAEVKASELIDAIMKGGVTLQEIMSKQLVESGQMIRRERSFEGVTIDWLSVEEGTDRRQREQFDEVAAIFNAIRNFQDDYITPIIDAKNEAAAEWGATVGHTQGTKDMGVKNVPFASKMYNLVNQLLFALKVDAVADRVVENLRNGYKPVISFTNTMEGFLSSAPKGVAMDEVPNFSLTLMRALDGVMRFTEKDADENTEGGSISLSELSAEGQKAYNAIRDKIMNLAADLPISPMDAIRMKIEEAGYSVAEITGRTMQLNRTADGKYIVEARKDRDKKAAMRDFNSGKLDVLMINKSGSTGISLHASSKFEDQRQRVMVFAQFQSDINDEVQMRGRIDRSGQVTRGRYEYIMSTIPAEQRIQMMFKAKLKSLDANTTSSQKSKFNEMEIVDYLNKYGDEVVWEYMKEHPELEERLGDPLDMLQEKDSEDGPRTSEKEDTSKKTGCAGKISRYLAFLSVDEQDEIFKEITEAYRVKIQLLDDAGENDLEITTMPLRAETKRKQIWHEGVNPGSGNAFADNTYVEEVEVDVLKKPMKRDEIIEATRKLVGDKGIVTEYDQMRYGSKVGEVNWTRYAREKEAEISQFFQEKADEAIGKLREAGEARIAKAREKAVAAATKARGRGENNFTDAEIQSLADTVANEEREKEERKQDKRRSEIMGVKSRIQMLLNRLRAGSIYVVPQDLKQGTPEMFSQTFGTFVGFKFNKSYTLGSSTAIFATLDGRRKVELALSDPAINTIISATEMAYRYSPKEINAITMENWDSNVPTQTRQKRYIITGNLLQALVDTEKGEKTRGNLISYSTFDGETRQGILMGENFKLTDLRNSASLSSRLAQIREGKAVVSENGDVQISKEIYDWRHRGEYELRVPKSKQRGGIYTMHPGLLKLVEGHNFITKGNNMVAYVTDENIANVVDMLSRAPFNLTVLQESQLSDVSENEAEEDVLCRPVTDKATLDRLNNEPTIKVYRAMQMIDGGLRPPMSGKVDGQWRDATEVGVWEEAEEHPEMADENGRFKLDKGNGKSIKAAYNPYIHTSRSPINDQFSSAWNRPELVTVEVEIPESELTSGYRAEKANAPVGEKDWKSGPVSRALAKIGQARRVILSRWSRIIRVVPVEEVAEAYAQRLNAHGIEVPFNTVPPALREALAERGVKIGKPEKGNAGKASMPAFEQWIMEQERQRQGDGYGAYTDAEVSFANDPVSKVMGKNRFSKKRQAEFAARERQRMVARIQELAERMHLDNVEVLTDTSGLEGKRAQAKGFFNKRTGKITIVLPNNYGKIDAEQTLLHEAVAHYGLRKLFGKHFDTFLDNVYQSAEPEIRRKIAEMAAKNGWDFRTATEEYLAGLAEDTNFDEARAYGGWWSRIKRLFIDMLEKIGFEGFRDNMGIVITDNELRYLLWRSYENLRGRDKGIFEEAADVAKQAELKVGNYAEHGIEADYAAEPSSTTELNEFNRKFNEELQKQINGKLPSGYIYQLGRPGKILQSTGVPDLPIQMSATRLQSKATEFGHNFDLSEIKNLVKELQDPMAVFAYGNKGKMQNIVVGIESNGKQFIVGLSLNPIVNGKALEVNSIRNVFPKDNAEWLNWISQGKLLYVDKQKIQVLIDKQRTILADVGYLNLDDVTKIVKSFENPTVEGEELFRPGDFTPRDKALARDEYERMVSSGSYQFKEAVQDSMLGLKKLYQAILDKGTRIENVSGFENAYLFENRMSSMNAGEHHEYFIRYMMPLLTEIGNIAGANERKRRGLIDYMIAKHGLERNKYMRNEAAANDEETDRDFAGLIGLTGESDWQSAEAAAQQWVDDYESSVDTKALWQTVNNATKATLEKIYLSGIISKETYEKIRDMYDYYIPLRGWDEKTSEEVYGYLMSKDGPLGGSIMKKAGGRSSKADDPIATIAMMADDAIRQGNRNLMKQRFLNFILNHPSDAVSLNDIWLEYDDVTDEWRPVFADIKETDTADEVAQKVKVFEQRMETLRNAEPDKYKKGREAQHIPYKVVKGNLKEHQVLIKRNGRTFVATINGNPRAAQALNGLTNPDVDQNGVVGNMLKAGTWVNRQLSAFYTTRNPDFVVGNFFRDMLYSNCMTWVKENPRYALRFHKNFGKFAPISPRRTLRLRKGLKGGTVYSIGMLLRKWERGTLDMADKYERLFYQFMKNGGETGYTNVRDIEGHKKAVAAELKKQGSLGRKAWTALGMQFDLLNRSAENCARFAAFVTSREFGRSIDRAIYDAKEISVNFNKKGSGGKMVNAVGQTKLGKFGSYLGGSGRLLYVFWNAGIQGFTNFGRQAKLHPAKFTVGAASLFTLGYLIPVLAEMLGGGDGDDDDKNAYYNLPEYIRRSNICFRAGGQWITIPLPIEYRAMYGMGELAHGVISGNERYSNSELAYQMASQVSQILPLDMLEGGGGISPFIPSAAKPFTEAYIMNKGWTGLPIYKDSPFNKNEPEWTKAYANADKHLVDFAKWLNETTGGDNFTKGTIDINPAKIEYLLNGTFGGVFSFPNKVKKFIETTAGKRDFEWRNVPLANRLIKSGDERTAFRKLQNEYFKYKEESEETGRRWRKYQKADKEGLIGYAEKVNFLENSPEYLRHEIFDSFKADINAYQELIEAETDTDKRAQLEAKSYALKRELVNALHDPASYLKKLYEAGQLDEEYIKYIENNHGIKLVSGNR